METTIISNRAGRTLQSSGSWAGAWNGAGLMVRHEYVPPGQVYSVMIDTTVTCYIRRAYLYFPSLQQAIKSAQLLLYVESRTAPGVLLYITKGVQGYPLDAPHWAPQNLETDIGGQIALSDLTPGQYNAIDLNATGLSWLNQAGEVVQEVEGINAGESTTNKIFGSGTRWWQSFKPLISHTVRTIWVKMFRKGDPGTITFNIKAADEAYKPTGPVLATATMDSAGVGTTAAWYEMPLDAPADLAQDTLYGIEFTTSQGDVSNNYIGIRICQASQYAPLCAAYSLDEGSNWTTSSAYGMFCSELNSPLSATGTYLCLRLSLDVTNSDPGAGFYQFLNFHSTHKGSGYEPKLTLTYAGGPQRNPAIDLIKKGMI